MCCRVKYMYCDINLNINQLITCARHRCIHLNPNMTHVFVLFGYTKPPLHSVFFFCCFLCIYGSLDGVWIYVSFSLFFSSTLFYPLVLGILGIRVDGALLLWGHHVKLCTLLWNGSRWTPLPKETVKMWKKSKIQIFY